MIERGHIYRFNDRNADNKVKFILIVSGEGREHEKYASTLSLGDVNAGDDVVQVDMGPEIGIKYVHCGMVSYIRKDRLSEEVSTINDDSMITIERLMAKALGINVTNDGSERPNAVIERLKSEKGRLEFERDFYKEAYDELMNRVVDKL